MVALTAAVYVVIATAAAWWALTTRKAWKRWLYIVVIAVLTVELFASVIAFTLWHPLGLLAISAAALAYAIASRRATLVGRTSPAPRTHPVQLPSKPWLLVNPYSGGGTAGRVGLIAVAADRGIDVHVLAPGDDPAALARRAVAEGADALGAAGGDGSLGPIAAIAIESGLPFVCIPAGTRNHFAHDLGLDRSDPLAALDALSGVERCIDAARVGDRVFLNNVSLGAYAEVVAEPGYRERKMNTARVVVRRLVRGERTPVEIEFADPDGRTYRDVQLLLVANNAYQLQRGSKLGARSQLDLGMLQVSVLRARSGSTIGRLLARAALGRFRNSTSWAQWVSASLRVESEEGMVPAGVDGEATLLSAPLEFHSLPSSLRMLVPADAAPRTGETSGPMPSRMLAIALRR